DPVTITSVVDNVLGDLTSAAIATNGGNPIVLAQNQSFTFTFTTAALNAGSATNTVTVTGHDDENTTVTQTATHTLNVADVQPSIAVTKTVAPIAEGNTATYHYTITNTSTASTDPVTVTSVIDDKLGDLTAAAIAANGGNPIVLAPGASFSFSFTTTTPFDA